MDRRVNGNMLLSTVLTRTKLGTHTQFTFGIMIDGAVNGGNGSRTTSRTIHHEEVYQQIY
jgi:hypothetical protein